MNVENWPIDRVRPYDRNPRDNSRAVAKVAASLAEFGWQQPLVVDSADVLVAGHTRLQAARSLGMAEVPVVVARGLSPEQVRAYRLADNRTHEEATWVAEALAAELKALEEAGYDPGLTGFEDREIARAVSTALRREQHDENEVPDPPKEPVTKAGDRWILGDHALVCGDSTSPEAVAAAIAGEAPHLMVTDPPYGVDYDPSFRSGNALKLGRIENDDVVDWRAAWAHFRGTVAYVWCADVHIATVQRGLEAEGFALRAMIVWVKDRFAMGRGNYHWQHEPALYAVRGEARWSGSRSESTVWSLPAREDHGNGHPTQKPVECMLRPMLNNSRRGDAVYDPFLGSGTSIIAAEKSGRRCFGLELSPAYCDVIVERWEQFTGGKARRG